MTHTYALLPVSAAVHAEITARLRAAGYGGMIHADGEIDMHGLVLVVEPAPIIYLSMINSTLEPDGSVKTYLERIDPQAYGGEAARKCHAAMASRWRYRDDSGALKLTFARWQDYRPTAES